MATTTDSKSLQRKKWVTNEELRIAYHYYTSTRATHTLSSGYELLKLNEICFAVPSPPRRI